MAATGRTNDASILQAGEWSVDAAHSSVAFAVRHMLVATVRGRFQEFAGTLTVEPGAISATGAVDAASIDTNDAVRDEHLRHSPDFFDVDRYPEIGFSSKRIEQLGARRLQIVGELTICGVSRELELDAQINDARRDRDGERIELVLRGELDRRDFGLVWNQAAETGGALLGNTVKLTIEISAVKGDRAR
jgi:polyisoprenoid-binding protein YceI